VPLQSASAKAPLPSPLGPINSVPSSASGSSGSGNCARNSGLIGPSTAANPWTIEPFLLVSSHLMHRRERQKDLLEAEPYDLDMLDEADHALTRRESNSSVAAFGEAPCNAVPEALRKSPLRKRKVLQSLNDIDPLFLSNLGIDSRTQGLACPPLMW